MSDIKTNGLLSWFATNSVAANLLMLLLVGGGLVMSFMIKKEVFPEFNLDEIAVTVVYPGASPEEIERGIVLPIEEALADIDDIDAINSIAREGMATIKAELLAGADLTQIYQDIQQAVGGITTFPADAESPVISISDHSGETLALAIYGDASQKELTDTANTIKDALLAAGEVSKVSVSGSSDYEVHVEISQATLEFYNLSISRVAQKINQGSVELPGGTLETSSGDILLRVSERRLWADEFAQLPIMQLSNGEALRLGEIATVKEGFASNRTFVGFNDHRAMMVNIYRVGDETPTQVSDAIKAALPKLRESIPSNMTLTISHDMADIYRDRLDLLIKNAFLGLLLVLVLLGLFLELKLAFWVTMGIPISFLGGLLFLPYFDVSINMISMFAFILSLGIVVDDAIIAGENIYTFRQQGMNPIEAAVKGISSVSVPLICSVLSNIVAFLPLFFLPGFIGKMMWTIPVVVTCVFIISMIEALFILPAHLAHSKPLENNKEGGNPVVNWITGLQEKVSVALNWFVATVYQPALTRCLNARYKTVVVGLSVMIVVFAYVASGRLGFSLLPRVEGNRIMATVTLPVGSPFERALEVRDSLVLAARNTEEAKGLIEDEVAILNANEVTVMLVLSMAEIGNYSAEVISKAWRQNTGQLVGIESIKFESDLGGPGQGAAITIELSHTDSEKLREAGEYLAAEMANFSQVSDLSDGYIPGKLQYDFTLDARGEALGLTNESLAIQIRNSVYGQRAVRQIRGRHETDVLVRLDEASRESSFLLETLKIQIPSGEYVDLQSVATLEQGRSFVEITRRDGQRTINVTANVQPIDETNQVMASLNRTVLPNLQEVFPELQISYRGKQKDTADSASSLVVTCLLAFSILYAMLAIPFKSYAQPLIVLLAIPFGMIGAFVGHGLMGFGLSMMSLLGIVALSGVVVNDSLVLVEYANRQKREMSPVDAIIAAGVRRFRPVILTTLTTFFGLMPMMLETSPQAKFLIPMAISLGFGVLFATLVCLILVPCLYIMIEDGKNLGRRIGSRFALSGGESQKAAI